jgi:glycosyltransferase involved in cell wall biosynthesis
MRPASWMAMFPEICLPLADAAAPARPAPKRARRVLCFPSGIRRHTAAGVRILVVLEHLPAVEGGAAAKCVLGMARGLQARGLDPVVLAATLGSDEDWSPPPDLRLEEVRIRRRPSWRARWNRLRNPRGLLASGEFGERLRELAASADVVHLDEVDPATAGADLSTPKAVHLAYLTPLDRDLGAPWRSEARDWVEYRFAERRVMRRNRWLVANSPKVATVMRRTAPRNEVTIVPLTLDPSSYETPARVEQPIAGLIGTAEWPPTVNAVGGLLSRVWPEVRRLAPDAELQLAGRGMTLERFVANPEATSSDVRWLGRVDSAAGFLRDLGVLLYPVTRGSGTKVKVLEAISLGVPVVTTRDGAEGLVSLDGVTVATDEHELARAAAELLRDPVLRAEQGARARQTFLEHHSPLAATQPLVELYERMLG